MDDEIELQKKLAIPAIKRPEYLPTAIFIACILMLILIFINKYNGSKNNSIIDIIKKRSLTPYTKIATVRPI